LTLAGKGSGFFRTCREAQLLYLGALPATPEDPINIVFQKKNLKQITDYRSSSVIGLWSELLSEGL